MLLAHRLWEEVAAGAEATLDDWDRAHAAAMRELDAEFDAQWRGLDTSEQKTLRPPPRRRRAVPHGRARRLELTKDVVRRALPPRRDGGDRGARGGGYSIVDPLFADWIGRLNDRPGVEDDGQVRRPVVGHAREAGDEARREPARSRSGGTGTTAR